MRRTTKPRIPNSLGIASHNSTVVTGNQNAPKQRGVPNMSGVRRAGGSPPPMPPRGSLPPVLAQPLPPGPAPSAPRVSGTGVPNLGPQGGSYYDDSTGLAHNMLPAGSTPQWGDGGSAKGSLWPMLSGMANAVASSAVPRSQNVSPQQLWVGGAPATPVSGVVASVNDMLGSPVPRSADVSPQSLWMGAGNTVGAQQQAPTQSTPQPAATAPSPTPLSQVAAQPPAPAYTDADADRWAEGVLGGLDPSALPLHQVLSDYGPATYASQRDQRGQQRMDDWMAQREARLAEARRGRSGWNSDAPMDNRPELFHPALEGREITGYHEGGISGGRAFPIYGMTPEQRQQDQGLMDMFRELRGRDDLTMAERQKHIPNLMSMRVGASGLEGNEKFQAASAKRQEDRENRMAMHQADERVKSFDRADRLKARQQAPNPMLWNMIQNPRLAMQMMEHQQRGQLGNRELDIRQEEARGRLQPDPLQTAVTRAQLAQQLKEQNPNLTDSEINARVNAQLGAVGNSPGGALGSGGAAVNDTTPSINSVGGLPEVAYDPATGAMRSPEEVRDALTQQGWPDAAINGVLRGMTNDPTSNVEYPGGVNMWTDIAEYPSRVGDFLWGLLGQGAGMTGTAPEAWTAPHGRDLQRNPQYVRPGRPTRPRTSEEEYWSRRGLGVNR